ncbi:MAG: hypothetical protein H7296_04555 [Bacteroidia bacterium]|nr:hypothetical protein [Bacteroidia bacterium]
MENFKVPDQLENPLILNRVATNAISGLVQFAVLSNVKILDAQSNPYTVDQGKEGDVPTQKFISKLGTVVYSNLIFNAGKELEGSIVVREWKDFRIDDALFSVSQAKKLVETEIQGKDGVVVEYIGLGAFQIQITGRITGGYNVYEKELVAELKNILKAGQPLAITSWYLQNLDITDVVIKDFNFGQVEGEYSTQYFTINCQSDQIVEATITGQ